jgi:hypothetical protein
LGTAEAGVRSETQMGFRPSGAKIVGESGREIIHRCGLIIPEVKAAVVYFGDGEWAPV